jgi:uncharacterized protein YbjT (DUF2867 family)
LHAAEERLADSPAKVTFLRASFFLENWLPVVPAAAHGKLPTFLPPERPVPMVATRDVGEVAARALLEGPPERRREIIELRGPREYSPRDLAAALAKVVGRTVELETPPLEALVSIMTSLGASPVFAEQVGQVYRAVTDGKLEAHAEGARMLRGAVDAETLFRAVLSAERPASIH